MNEIMICKAQPIGLQMILDKTIILSGEPPYLESLQDMGKFYSKEAKELADVLETTLPGGTFDRLVAELLTRKAGHSVVSWREEKPEEAKSG